MLAIIAVAGVFSVIANDVFAAQLYVRRPPTEKQQQEAERKLQLQQERAGQVPTQIPDKNVVMPSILPAKAECTEEDAKAATALNRKLRELMIATEKNPAASGALSNFYKDPNNIQALMTLVSKCGGEYFQPLRK